MVGDLDDRTRRASDAPIRPDGSFVVYWMEAARRLHSNFALDRAVQHATALGKPLLIVEVLRNEGSATAREWKFVLDGMRDHGVAAAGGPVTYLTCVERTPGTADAFLERLLEQACVLIGDSFLDRKFGRSFGVRTELVDCHGLVPLMRMERAAPSAYVFRRWAQVELQDGWGRPSKTPLAGLHLPVADVGWPGFEWVGTQPDLNDVGGLDRAVEATSHPGGPVRGAQLVDHFVARVASYPADRQHPDACGGSGLSAYLHFGHVAATDVVDAILAEQNWSPDEVGAANGKREGWWGLDEGREAFLDQLITWRELGAHFAWHTPGYRSYETLPPWAQETLQRHAKDARPVEYSLEQLEEAATHDEIWNAAQRELLQTGHMHNYLRMLWGKKILEWSATPREAYDRAVYLNDRWALDGRDPNSYSGIGWIFGRFDRPWGPRREIFGTIRYMSSASAKRKLRMKDYLERFGELSTASRRRPTA